MKYPTERGAGPHPHDQHDQRDQRHRGGHPGGHHQDDSETRGGPHRGHRRGFGFGIGPEAFAFGPGSFGGFGPGGFGPGDLGGFGPRGRGRRGGPGRRTSRGDVRAAVLALVAEQPRHGYEIIQEIGERSGGRWHPSPGSIYPTVAQLEDEGLVDTEKVEGRRMVQLTDAGRAYVAEHREELDALWAKASEDPDEQTADLRAETKQLIAAVQQIAGIGNPEQLQKVAGLLAEARKGIYRMLAE